ncbi:MAG: ribonuclease III [Candidatus Omnitrophica bacterium]|nr:ribonuclease III [Candidatus Omnitrophota bacterium]
MMRLFFRGQPPRERTKELHQLEKALGVRFRDLSLLNHALVHSSHFSSVKPGTIPGDNETLEFLGDAVVGLVISDELYKRSPVSAAVGDLAKVKSHVVSRASLGKIAQEMGLDRWILLGPGEKARGEAQRPSVIGSALEAVLGAVYVDRGFKEASRLIHRLFHQMVEESASGESDADYKSLLQEYTLRYFRVTPDYRVVAESGPGHRRRFQVTVGWRGKVYGQGSGPNKKAASQDAAQVALNHLLSPRP